MTPVQDEQRIGVFICDCGGMTEKQLDLDALAEHARNEKRVVLVQRYRYLCSMTSRELIASSSRTERLDRIVIAACSPRIYLEEFREAASSGGMNRYMVDMTNIREQNAWIHSEDLEGATAKAKNMISISVARCNAMHSSSSGPLAMVNTTICSGCGVCPDVCRAHAISLTSIDNGKTVASVDRTLCTGCGACVAACPSGALDMSIYSNEEMVAMLDAATEGLLDSKRPFPLVVVFACDWCGYSAADLAGLMRLQIDTGFRVIRTPCSARVDPEWILRAFSRGADGVLVLGGSEGHCHYIGGNVKTISRMSLLSRLLIQYGYDVDRFSVKLLDPNDAFHLVKAVEDILIKIQEIGPNPLRAPEKEHMLTSALHHD